MKKPFSFLSNLIVLFKKDYVTVKFSHLANEPIPICELEKKIKSALSTEKAGKYNCFEIVGSQGHKDGYLYLEGSNGRKLLRAIRPVIKSFQNLQNIKVQIQNGKTTETDDLDSDR